MSRAAPPPRALLAALDHPDSLWNRLAGATPQVDPFCCRSEWQLSYHEAFAPERELILRSDGASLLACARRRHPQVGVLLEPVEASWLFGAPLLGAAAPELLAATLGEAPGPAPFVLLSGLAPDGAPLRAVVRRFARRFTIARLETAVLRSASLAGGADGFLARRSARFRSNLRRAVRRASERGIRFERERPQSAREADVLYERMLRVEAVSWKGLARCGIAEPPALEFYRLLLRRLGATGAARAVFARNEGRDIGFVFGGVAGDVYRGQQFSFDEAWRESSIGNLLQWEQIRWLCEQGALRYDMGPEMEYKRHWAEHEHPSESLVLRPRS